MRGDKILIETLRSNTAKNSTLTLLAYDIGKDEMIKIIREMDHTEELFVFSNYPCDIHQNVFCYETGGA